MSLTSKPATHIKTRTPWKRRIAATILDAHRQSTSSTNTVNNATAVRIVCISDTHNKRPKVPIADILIHAGDLTETGSFDEVQAELAWLASLPHKHKILIAGNHDVLLDDAFLNKYPERRYGQSKTRHDLDWGDVMYLQDSSITLDIGTPPDGAASGLTSRKITIFGSPWTPQYGASAFQYRPSDYNHWEDIFSSIKTAPDIIVTHGPPRLHLDQRDFHRAGCPYLAQEIRRLRPLLHVFGHIHAAYGQEKVVLDNVQSGYEEIMTGWAGWGTLVYMVVMAVSARITQLFKHFDNKATVFVNAAVVGGAENALKNEPILIEL